MHYTYSSLSTVHRIIAKKEKPAAPASKAIAKAIWDRHFAKGAEESRKAQHFSENREDLSHKLEFLEATIGMEKRPKEDFMSSRTMYGLAGIVGGLLLNIPLSNAAADICSYLGKGALPITSSQLMSHINFAISHAGWPISLLSAAYGRAGFVMQAEFSKLSLFVEYAKTFSHQCWQDAFKAQKKE